VNKKNLILLIFLTAFATGLFAEKLTMIGIVDLTKIVSNYFKDSTAWREIDELTKKVEDTTNTRLEEIKALQVKKIDAENKGDNILSLQLGDEITKKKQYLQEYHKIMSDRISSKKNNLLTSSGFSKQIIDAISFIATDQGFSIVLRKKDPDILYYNYDVDITDKVIDRLMKVK